MPFVSRPGPNGKIYIPEERPGQKKHACKTCFSCQVCSDDRCSLCLIQTGDKKQCNRIAAGSFTVLADKNPEISI